MRDDALGNLNSKFRTSYAQAVTLFVVAAIFAALTGYFVLDEQLRKLQIIAIVLACSAIYFLWWGANLAVHVLEVRERGVSLRFLTRRINIPFAEIEAVGVRRRTVNGLPGSYCGVWFKRRDGSIITFALESNAEEASNQIARSLAAI